MEAVIKSEVGEAITQTGTVTLSPLKAEGEVELQGVPVNRYAPYYGKFLLFDIQEGTVDLSTKYVYAKEENHTTLSGLTTTSSLCVCKNGERRTIFSSRLLSPSGKWTSTSPNEQSRLKK